MAVPTRMSIDWPGRRIVVPFLIFAYPTTFLLYQGGVFCSPVCFTPTLAGAGYVVGSICVSLGLAYLVTRTLADDEGATEWPVSRRLVNPGRSASVMLVVLFAAFVGFLTLDALTLSESLWKPLVLPASFLLFLPVWALYVVTFPLAALFAIAGVESSPLLTLALRSIVLFVGFALSAVWQSLLASVMSNSHQR